jgi:TorA maturation chaperone TorD
MNRFFDLIPGYQPESNLSDHIGVQLDFLSTILRQPDEVAASEVTGLFAREHLQWTLMFVDKVEAQSDSEFYRGLAKVTRNLVQTITASVVPKA